MMESKKTILVVDDTPENIDVLFGVLSKDYKVKAAPNGAKALKIAGSEKPPDLILLDIMMPEMDGYEVCQKIKEDERIQDIPVIFVTAKTETEDENKGFEVGAVDYIIKPISPPIVKARVRTHLALKSAGDALKDQNRLLEQKVEERTSDLVALNKRLERFVPKEFISLLGKKSIIEINLGDQVNQEMTVMFADIRGWSTLSESMTPQENFQFLNTYLSYVAPVINRHDGFIDQYYGDGVMALYPSSADEAVMAAIDMHRAVDEFNEQRKKENLQPIVIGVGLHTGDLMLGIIGDRDRMQGSVVSDAVNLAARLEGLTRIYGSSITLSEPTLKRLKGKNYQHRFVDKVQVKGKMEVVSVHEVFDGDSPSTLALKEQTKVEFEKGLDAYYSRRFSQASVSFDNVLGQDPEDKAARIYLKRCAHNMVNGVPEDWTGIETLNRK
jgi:two-component system, sensor histidine kinase ChiS